MPTLQAQQKFDSFHDANPGVYDLFKTFALQLIAAGKTKVGARLIGERIRWETNIKTNGPKYNLNDHYWPFYARQFIQDHPTQSGLFEFRQRSQ